MLISMRGREDWKSQVHKLSSLNFTAILIVLFSISSSAIIL